MLFIILNHCTSIFRMPIWKKVVAHLPKIILKKAVLRFLHWSAYILFFKSGGLATKLYIIMLYNLLCYYSCLQLSSLDTTWIMPIAYNSNLICCCFYIAYVDNLYRNSIKMAILSKPLFPYVHLFIIWLFRKITDLWLHRIEWRLLDN